MMGNLWFFLALGASILWGLSYALSERVLNAGLTPIALIVFTEIITLPIGIGLLLYFNQFEINYKILISSWQNIGLFLLMAFGIIGGNILIVQSIDEKNATLASLVEISYPFFTALFVWLLFKEVQVNIATALGGLLIFSGIAMIYMKG